MDTKVTIGSQSKQVVDMIFEIVSEDGSIALANGVKTPLGRKKKGRITNVKIDFIQNWWSSL